MIKIHISLNLVADSNKYKLESVFRCNCIISFIQSLIPVKRIQLQEKSVYSFVQSHWCILFMIDNFKIFIIHLISLIIFQHSKDICNMK